MKRHSSKFNNTLNKIVLNSKQSISTLIVESRGFATTKKSASSTATKKATTTPTKKQTTEKAATPKKVVASAATKVPTQVFPPLDGFTRRHIGPRENEIKEMLEYLGFESLDKMMESNVPEEIRLKKPLDLHPPRGEAESLADFQKMMSQNKVFRSFIGTGFYGTVTPAVILRNILENPGWYTPYTPYQAEISQGRLEMLMNYQTMITDLTGMDVSNASLLDESSAAGEAMYMSWQLARKKKFTYLVDSSVHPQTIAVIRTRCEALGIKIVVEDLRHSSFDAKTNLTEGEPDPSPFGIFIQYPGTNGRIASDYEPLVKRAKDAGLYVTCATDLLALALIKPPGEFGCDIAVGTSQRFGVPFGFGGPHAGFFACKDAHKRLMPGRLIGLSRDANGDPAIRMALQTREQHIRRETATSNICTAQALLANISAAYAVYHGPEGIRQLAERVHQQASTLATGLRKLGYKISNDAFFDTVLVNCESAGTNSTAVLKELVKRGINVRAFDENSVTISIDETVTDQDLVQLLAGFSDASTKKLSNAGDLDLAKLNKSAKSHLSDSLRRSSKYLTHPNFSRYHSEHDMLRYLKALENRDISLTNGPIMLGSCTMKLNATSEMIPVTFPEVSNIHPFAPLNQTKGYTEMLTRLERYLCAVTGFDAVSFQPNSGAAGEYAGLMAIRRFHQHNKQGQRDVCLIPTSAHGTNPASAAVAGFKVVTVKTNKDGTVDLEDLKLKVEENKERLAALMVTYPSTYGVFEEGVAQAIQLVHNGGGLVYMDGANMNSQVGLTSPGLIGADVCHLNLHKTFCIPHGGGGPGMGPICVRSFLQPFLPIHPLVEMGKLGGKAGKSFGTMTGGAYSSASILPISYMYIDMMGTDLKKSTQVAILNANYMKKRLETHYEVAFSNKKGMVAHEFILKVADFGKFGIKAEDIAKRLIDYGFHAPTLSWPLPDSLMPEPTESEPKEALDRFCDALIAIRQEIRDVEQGKYPQDNNPLKNAPHTLKAVTNNDWNRPYSREVAAFPLPFVRPNKYWPAVSRVDSVFGDKHLTVKLVDDAQLAQLMSHKN